VFPSNRKTRLGKCYTVAKLKDIPKNWKQTKNNYFTKSMIKVGVFSWHSAKSQHKLPPESLIAIDDNPVQGKKRKRDNDNSNDDKMVKRAKLSLGKNAKKNSKNKNRKKARCGRAPPKKRKPHKNPQRKRQEKLDQTRQELNFFYSQLDITQ